LRGGSKMLDPLIEEAAKIGSQLAVDPLPRLVIFSSEKGKDVSDASWSPHEAKIANNGIAMILKNLAEEVVLPAAAAG
jgi:hypothetical protein